MSGIPAKISNRDLLLILLVIVLWGLNFVPTKYALHDFTPLQLGMCRFLLTAFPLILLVRRPAIPLRWLFYFGLTQGVGQFGLLFFALKIGMTAAMASVLMQTQIFFTAMMGAALLGEAISRSLMVGMGVAGLGLLCFAINVISIGGAGTVTAEGFMLTLIAAAMWASSNIVVKKLQASGFDYTPLSLLVWSSLISGISFGLMSLVFDDGSLAANWMAIRTMSWVSLLYIGWMAGGVAFWLWTLLLTRYPASRVAPFSLGIPIIGLLVGIFVLDEQVTPLQWVGSAFVLSALLIVVSSSRYSLARMKRNYDQAL